MSGCAGRRGLDDEGHVIMNLGGESSENHFIENMVKAVLF